MTISSALIDLQSITLRDLRAIENPQLTLALRRIIDEAAGENATAIQMQNE